MKRLLTAILVIGIVMTLSGCAGTAEMTENTVFRKLDADSDGKIDFEEYDRYMKERSFDMLDRNDDDSVTRNEWESLEYIGDTERHSEVFRRMDKNRNRKISFFEFSNYADGSSNIEESFMVNDKDKDNALSPDEISSPPIFRMMTIRFKLF